MGALEINGWAVPVSDPKINRETIGDIAPSAAGNLIGTLTAKKSIYKLKTGLLSMDEAEALKYVLQSKGDVWQFNNSLYSAKGLKAAFTRNSVAYKSDGSQVAANVPRYEDSAANFGKGVMVEEGTTNLLTANQASAETDLTGFGYWQCTLARVSTGHWHGSYAVEATLTAAMGTTSIIYNLSAPVVGTAYAGSMYVKGPAGKQSRLTLRMYGGANAYKDVSSADITLTGGWQRISTLNSVDYADRTQLQIHAWGIGAIGDKFYFDGFQLEQKPCVTSWQLPGTARAAEALSVSTSGIQTAQGSIGFIVNINTNSRRQDGNYNRLLQINDSAKTNWLRLWHAPSSAVWGMNIGATPSSTISDALTPDGWYWIRITWNTSIAKAIFYNIATQTIVGTMTINNPNLPTAWDTVLWIGSLNGTSNFVDAVFDSLFTAGISFPDSCIMGLSYPLAPMPYVYVSGDIVGRTVTNPIKCLGKVESFEYVSTAQGIKQVVEFTLTEG